MKKIGLLLSMLCFSFVALANEPIYLNTDKTEHIVNVNAVLRVDRWFVVDEQNHGKVALYISYQNTNSSGAKSKTFRFDMSPGELFTWGDYMYLKLEGRDPILVAKHVWFGGRFWKPVDNVQIKYDLSVDLEVAEIHPYVVIW